MASEKALRNPLVLRQIFLHSPKSLLLSSCSLVNKIWRKEALTCFRDRRKYAAVKTQVVTDCKFLQQLDQICCQMVQDQTWIPWNALNLNLDPGTCRKDHGGDEKIELLSPFIVKHLEIFWDLDYSEPDCSVHQPLRALFCRNWNQLKSLKLTNLPPAFPSRVFGESFSGLPKLEKITISTCPKLDHGFRIRLGLDEEQAYAVRELLKAAPNLKRISVNDAQSLRMVPEESYKMLETLEFRLPSVEDASLFQTVAENRPKLRKLRINQSNWDQSTAAACAQANNLEQAFNRSLQQLLASCHQTLEKLEIASPYPFTQLSFPPLVNLRELKLLHKFGMIQDFYKDLISLEYVRRMPNLSTLEVHMSCLFREKFPASSYVDNKMEDQVRGNGSNIRKLTLVLRTSVMDLMLMKSIFPNVRSLNIRVRQVSPEVGRGFMPLLEICQLWPNLQELRISGADFFQPLNYDAYFCGILEEEAYMLRGMDKDYLKAVHIVPVRHCILTMPDLRILRIDFGATEGLPGTGVCWSLTSVVTEMVAFQRPPGMQVSIVGAFSLPCHHGCIDE